MQSASPRYQAAMLREIKPGSADFQRFEGALVEAGLPIDDLTSEPFIYFTAEGLAWGGVGMDADALLRSIVVAPEARQRGLGALITEGIAAHACDVGVQRLWLLTTDAMSFFEKLGWRAVDRKFAPETIARSRQFSGLCPSSATLMTRAL